MLAFTWWRTNDATHPTMKLAPSEEPVAASETQRAVAIQPVTNDRPFFQPSGARMSGGKGYGRYAYQSLTVPPYNSQTHSYCPPEVG